MIKAGIMGAAGYAGAELVRILAQHPDFAIQAITSDSDAGTPLVELYPAFVGSLDNLVFVPHDDPSLLDCDVVFMAVPHKAGMLHAPRLVAAGINVVDLSADFRFNDASRYEAAYGVTHAAPELLEHSVFGQPETMRSALENLAAQRAAGTPGVIGCAGCYVTASILAGTPALAGGLVNPDAVVVIDAISGVTGAGRKATARTHYCNADESAEPYGLPHHRHAPEIAQGYGRALAAGAIDVSAELAAPLAHVVFTPHLAPFKRGILATVYIPLNQDVTAAELHAVYAKAYEGSPLVSVLPQGSWPKTSSVAGTARAQLGVTVNEDEHMAICVCAIDNLGKGAAAQAVQCANILFGLDEAAGLSMTACAS